MQTDIYTEIAERTKELLNVGRGNVYNDIISSDGESAICAKASRILQDYIRRDFNNRSAYDQNIAKAAITGYLMSAGNCDEHAALAYVIACKLADDDTQLKLISSIFDHAFVLLGEEDMAIEDFIIIDAWDTSKNGLTYGESEWYDKGNSIAYEGKAVLGTDLNTAEDKYKRQRDKALKEMRKRVRQQCDDFEDAIASEKFKAVKKIINEEPFGFKLWDF